MPANRIPTKDWRWPDGGTLRPPIAQAAFVTGPAVLLPDPPVDVDQLRRDRDELLAIATGLCGQFVNSHGRDKVICLCCDLVSNDQVSPMPHEPECEVAEAIAVIARIRAGK